MTDVARNCTRHAFTDGRCRERPDGCRDCPAEFHLPPLHPSPKHSLIEILNIALNAAALTDTASIFDAIRRLRNNLMHGTKGKLFVRDQTLCADALEVVKLAYEFCQKSADPTLQAVARKMADF